MSPFPLLRPDELPDGQGDHDQREQHRAAMGPRDQVAAQFEEVERLWGGLGSDAPLWSALTHPKFRVIDSTSVFDFMESGQEDVSQILAQASPPNRGKALDFGCGPGRLTRALAKEFGWVVGADISAPMLQAAASLGGLTPNTSFTQITSAELPFEDGEFDMVISLLVFQHLPFHLAARFLREIIRVLGPEGVAAIQFPVSVDHSIPSGPPPDDPGDSRIRMHCFPFGEVLELADEEGVSFEAKTMDICGPQFDSRLFLFRR